MYSFKDLMSTSTDLYFMMSWAEFFYKYGKIIIIAVIVFILLMLVCSCKLAAKAGYPWWSMLVPIYNIIVLMKITHGWKLLLLSILFLILEGVSGSVAISLANDMNFTVAYVFAIIQIPLLIIALIFSLRLCYRYVKRYGYGFGMLVIYIILPIIALPVMAFSKKKALTEEEFSLLLKEKQKPNNTVINTTQNASQVTVNVTSPVKEQQPVYNENKVEQPVYNENKVEQPVYNENKVEQQVYNENSNTMDYNIPKIDDAGMPDFGEDL